MHFIFITCSISIVLLFSMLAANFIKSASLALRNEALVSFYKTPFGLKLNRAPIFFAVL